MPAIMDDPSSPTIHRVSGEAPYPDPNKPSLPANITPRQVTLRDRQTVATIVPFATRQQVPPSLLTYLGDQFAKEIDKGDTYPMIEAMPNDKFAAYWFQNFGAIMLLGSIERPEDVVEGKDWSKECLGSFYIKPNYPGRSSHVCNAGFLVTDASRNRGVGRLMGEAYIDWAPKLGYTYSVFNLVYETNVASCKIWDALGFKRIGRVKGCGNLKSYPGRLIDAIIYGRDLSVNEESEELVSEERFEKIKFYLKHGKYPNGADRAEKSRLRSAATHYKLLEGDILMLKDKEVISDPARQYEIARQVHAQQHGGINKTTATITERYHWSRIKDTVSDVIKACAECKDGGAKSSLVKSSTPNQNSSVPSPLPRSPAPLLSCTSAAPDAPLSVVSSTDRGDAVVVNSAHHMPQLSWVAQEEEEGGGGGQYPHNHASTGLRASPGAVAHGADMHRHHHHHHHHHLYVASDDDMHGGGSENPSSLPIPHPSESHAYEPIDPQIMMVQGYSGHHMPTCSFQQPPHFGQNYDPSRHNPESPCTLGDQLADTDIEVGNLQQLLAASSHDHLEATGYDVVHERGADAILAPQEECVNIGSLEMDLDTC